MRTKARELIKTGWQVPITDSDSRMFHAAQLDEILKFDRKPDGGAMPPNC